MGRQIQRQDRDVKDAVGAQGNFNFRAVIVLVGLMLMLLVPVAALDDQRPAKFGWHMYAAAVDLPKVEIEFSDGNRRERNVGNIASGFRPEIDYFRPIAHHLCTREADAVSVIMTRQHPEQRVVITCEEF
jgi:hypothetical protein